MNFAYYRKSKYGIEETLNNLKQAAADAGLSIISETKLPHTKSIFIQVCSTEWLDSLLQADKNLIGLLPCNILILQTNNEVYIGSGNPSILKGVSENASVQKLATIAEDTYRKIVNIASGAGEQKVTNLKVYSTTTCPYCTMEKQWLEENKITHNIVYVDKDHKEAEKMVQNTGQMGVPVTEVVYDDGESEYIVGFNKVQLSKVLGLSK